MREIAVKGKMIKGGWSFAVPKGVKIKSFRLGFPTSDLTEQKKK